MRGLINNPCTNAREKSVPHKVNNVTNLTIQVKMIVSHLKKAKQKIQIKLNMDQCPK